jgi:hypothetical protein
LPAVGDAASGCNSRKRRLGRCGTGGPNTRALRLSSVDGQARVVQDGQIVADPALANMPLFAGSQITTGNDGRVEVQFEDGSVVRLSPNSTLTFSGDRKAGTNAHTEVVLNNGSGVL